MRLTVVGSADAFNGAGRGHSCYWLEGAQRTPLMIDFGPTALQGLNRIGLDPRRLGAIIATHLHGDHVGGLPFLFLDGMFHRPRLEALPLLGPTGTRAKVEAIVRAAYHDLSDLGLPFELRVREVEPGVTVDFGEVRVETFAADHMDPPDRPLCLRLTGTDGTVIAFSGDTAPSEGLLEAARGAALLVAECTALEPPAGRHCTWHDWRTLVGRVGARRILLSHLGAAVREAIPRLLAEHRGDLPIEFADDGMVVEV